MLHENTLTVRKSELLDKLKANREKHVAEYKSAHGKYLLDLLAQLEKRIAEIEEGKDVNAHFTLTKPRSFEREYTRAISMLEMTTADSITITVQQFNNYVLDEWHWAAEFATSTASYK